MHAGEGEVGGGTDNAPPPGKGGGETNIRDYFIQIWLFSMPGR